jgi:hypothetical protein
MTMKGLMYLDQDLGHGGPDGFASLRRAWCVDVDGRKLHIEYSVTGSGRECDPFKHDVVVGLCNGSCAKLVDISHEVMSKALPLIHSEDRPLVHGEMEALPPDLGRANYLLEVLVQYRLLQNELVFERKKTKAAARLRDALKGSVARMFFRDELEDCDKAERP